MKGLPHLLPGMSIPVYPSSSVSRQSWALQRICRSVGCCIQAAQDVVWCRIHAHPRKVWQELEFDRTWYVRNHTMHDCADWQPYSLTASNCQHFAEELQDFKTWHLFRALPFSRPCLRSKEGTSRSSQLNLHTCVHTRAYV